jgi:hypothetical protein
MGYDLKSMKQEFHLHSDIGTLNREIEKIQKNGV